MKGKNLIDVETFKIISKAIAASDNLEIMINHLSQLLVATLEIKGSTIFVLNRISKELEALASFGLSTDYLSKGPVMSDRSIASALEGDPVIIEDISNDNRLQYPKEAKEEGIAAILSIPIRFAGESLGVLRLYHHEVWEVSRQDCDSLLILAEQIGMSMQYTRLLNVVRSISEALMELPMCGPAA